MTDNEWAATVVMGWHGFDYIDPSSGWIVGAWKDAPPDEWGKVMAHYSQWNPAANRDQLWMALQNLDEGQRDQLLISIINSKTWTRHPEDSVFDYFIDTPPAEVLRLVRSVVE